jgi:hypothetical protein
VPARREREQRGREEVRLQSLAGVCLRVRERECETVREVEVAWSLIYRGVAWLTIS